MKKLIFLEVSADPYYGQSVCEGLFIPLGLYEKYQDKFFNFAKTYGWHEIAGKHSYTEAESYSFTEVNQENIFDFVAVDPIEDAVDQLEFLSPYEGKLLDKAQLIRERYTQPETVTILKSRYLELLEIEEKHKTPIFAVVFYNRFGNQTQVYQVRAKNAFRAGRMFYKKYNRTSYHSCIETIYEINI